MTKIREEQIISINILDRDGYGEVNANNSVITNLSNPINDQDASTKYYVDSTHQTLSQILYTSDDADGYDIININLIESNDGYFYNDVEIGNNLEVNNDLIVSGDIELFSGNINNANNITSNSINSNDGYFSNNVVIDGKLTVEGLIDPTGLVLTHQSSLPGGTPEVNNSTIWIKDPDGYIVYTNSSGEDNVLAFVPEIGYLSLDGSTPMIGDLNLNNHKIYNITTLESSYLITTPNDATFNFGSNDIIIGDGYIKAESSLTNYIGLNAKLSLDSNYLQPYTASGLSLGSGSNYWLNSFILNNYIGTLQPDTNLGSGTAIELDTDGYFIPTGFFNSIKPNGGTGAGNDTLYRINDPGWNIGTILVLKSDSSLDDITIGSTNLYSHSNIIFPEYSKYEQTLDIGSTAAVFIKTYSSMWYLVNLINVNNFTSLTIDSSYISSSTDALAYILSGNSANSTLYFGDSDSSTIAAIDYSNNTNEFTFKVSSSNKLSLSDSSLFPVSDNDLGLGTSSYRYKDLYVYDGYFDSIVFNNGLNLTQVYDVLNEPSGFPNTTESTISVDDGTLTFSIAPVSSSFDFYIKGVKYTKTSTDSVVWTDVEGIHFFYYNTSGVLTHTVSENDWVVALLGSGALVAAIYWSSSTSTTIYFAEERHGFMDPRVHAYLHSAFGTQWIDGGQLTNILADQNGSLNSHAQLGVSTVTVADEDLRFTYTDDNPQNFDPIAYIPIYYRWGSGQDWRIKTADTFPFIQSGTAGYTGASGLPAYNQYTGGSWTLTQVSNTNFFLVHYYIGNDKTSPVFGVLGELQYGNLGAAQTGALTEINQIGSVLRNLSKEAAPLGTVIFEVRTTYANSVKARIVSTEEGDDYIDFRGNALTGSGASSGGITDHGNLTGLADDDHTQYLLIDGTRAMTGSLDMGTNSISNITTLESSYLTTTPNDATFNFGSNDIIIGDGYIKAESSLINYIGDSQKLALTGTVLYPYITNDLYFGDSSHYWKDGYFTRLTLPQNVIAIGIEAAISGTPAGLIGIGYQAAKLSTTASVAIGYQALSSNISGANSTAIGYSAGKAMTNNNGTFIGYNAGISCTSENIVAIGVNSLYASTASSSASVSVGVNSLYSLTSGIGNATLGYYAGFGIINGHYNVAIGYQALQNASLNATQMDGNIAIGVNSGLNSYSNYNIFIGYNCGGGITTGASNTILGASAYSSGNYSNSTAIGANSTITANNMVKLGDSSTTVYCYGINSAGNILPNVDNSYNFGSSSYNYKEIYGIDGYFTNIKISGNIDAENSVTAIDGYFTNQVVIGGKLTVGGIIDPTGLVLTHESSVPGGTPETGTSIIWIKEPDGYIVYTNSLGNDNVLAYTPAVGYLSLDGSTPMIGDLNLNTHSITGVTRISLVEGTGNTILGSGISSSISGTNETIIGYQAGAVLTSGIGNTLIGNTSGDSITTGGYNTTLGYNSLSGATSASNCVAIGYESLLTNNSNNIIAVGYQAGRSATGSNNIFIGYQTGYTSTGGSAILIGYQAGYALTSGNINTLIGASSGDSLTTGNYNTTLGYSSLGGATSASNCVAIGYESLLTNNSSNITAVGYQAGRSATGVNCTWVGYRAGYVSTGNYNTAIGDSAGLALSTGSSNNLFGNGSGSSLNTGSYNIAIGTSALNFATTANGCVAIGHGALNTANNNSYTTAIGYASGYNATGTGNTFIGYNTGVNSTGGYGTIVGYNAGTSLTSGAANTLIGNSSGDSLTTGGYNTAVGVGSLGSNSTGGSNVAIGYNALTAYAGSGNVAVGFVSGEDITGASNTLIGYQTAKDATTTAYSTIVGYNAGLSLTTGNYSTLFGYQAGDAITDGDYNIAIGVNALGGSTTADNCIAIGPEALLTTNSSGTMGIGFQAGRASSGSGNTFIGYQTGITSTGGNETLVGFQSGYALTTGVSNTLIGYRVGDALTTGSYNISLGVNALGAATTSSYCVAIGYESLLNTTLGNYITSIGYQSGRSADGYYNTLIGYQTGYTSTSDNLTLVGHKAGYALTTGSSNTLIGSLSGDSINTGNYNVTLGYNSLSDATTASNCVAIGYESLLINNTDSIIAIGYQAGRSSTGSFNTFIGYQSGYTSTGGYNTTLGYQAGYSITDGTTNNLIGVKSGYAITSGIANNLIGYNAGLALNTGSYNSVIGYNSLITATTASNCIAIGHEALYNNNNNNNIAIGYQAGRNSSGADNNTFIGYQSGYSATGSDNTALGYQSGVAVTTGNNNTILGYSSGVALTTGNYNTSIGSSSFYSATTSSNCVAIGFEALYSSNNSNAIAIGYQAGKSSTGDFNTYIGYQSGYTAAGTYNTTTGYKTGYALTTGNYNTLMGTISGQSITTGSSNTSFGSLALRDLTGGFNNTSLGANAGERLTVGSNNTFLGILGGRYIEDGYYNVAVGAYSLYGLSYGAVDYSTYKPSHNIAIGYRALYDALTSNGSVAIGTEAGFNITSGVNIAIGYQSLYVASTGSGNISLGYQAGYALTTGDNNTLIGNSSGNTITTGANNTCIGYDSDVNAGASTNCTTLGYQATVTGSNQVQLGNSSTTTYAYGAVQDRSDIRDKADIRNTILGLDFINKLHPVDYKWNYREDYQEGDEELSHIRERYHHGLIAQEVKEVIDNLGIDFGGYQDHSINGGKDVRTLGYNEFIAPLIKAVQELSSENSELKNRLQKIEEILGI